MADVRSSILVVDDEAHSVASMKMALEDEFDVFSAGGADEARRIMREEWIQVIICDHRMPGQTGVDFLSEAREHWPETVRLIITGYTDPIDMIQAINEAGVQQFITKPWHPDQLVLAARNAVRLFQLARENERLALEMRYLATTSEKRLATRRKALKEGRGFESILRGLASPMNTLVRKARQYASFHVPVLLTGEAGTGKSDIARAMHLISLRSDRPFLAFNLAGVPDELIETELFGAKRGALPGGVNKVGIFRKADRGTIYLGGIDELSPAMQLKLYRVIQDRIFVPLGSQEPMTTDPRLILGSCRPLGPLVESGAFRGDLYHAISTGNLRVPPLRERRDDIALIVDQLISDLSSRHGKAVTGIEMAALKFLEAYRWPGNLPELENEITRMLIMAQDRVLSADLISGEILQAPQPGDAGGSPDDGDVFPAGIGGTLKEQVEHVETRILRAA
ncbi:MAG: sigma-54-dependent Fis family transcriptional regulator, partial [Hyphomicrobiales bacterium]|nr:sigma-54-dependent Fis family transcriptional regulator [Hyphomicrobiales bacterium]